MIIDACHDRAHRLPDRRTCICAGPRMTDGFARVVRMWYRSLRRTHGLSPAAARFCVVDLVTAGYSAGMWR